MMGHVGYYGGVNGYDIVSPPVYLRSSIGSLALVDLLTCWIERDGNASE